MPSTQPFRVYGRGITFESQLAAQSPLPLSDLRPFDETEVGRSALACGSCEFPDGLRCGTTPPEALLGT
jgi:hypothetical protein